MGRGLTPSTIPPFEITGPLSAGVGEFSRGLRLYYAFGRTG
jgi:hypothetical protein